MAIGDTPITVIGNVVAEPELRFTPSGNAVANFRVASTPRTFNRQSNQWEDGEALFLTCNAWNKMAENIAESLQKGMRVIVNGRLKQRSYETKTGDKRIVFEVEVDEAGPALRYGYATFTRNPREGLNQQQQAKPAQDQWNSQPTGGFTNTTTQGAIDDEPPF